jgi:hypothetical protein
VIISRPSTREYREGWDRVFGTLYHPMTICQVCKSESDGNLDKCPVCRSVWVSKRFPNGVYVRPKPEDFI